jgi:uridine monophosphate synthetase
MQPPDMLATRLSYRARAGLCKHPLAKQLLYLMADKQTNLALSADVTSAENLIGLIEQTAAEICILKTHIDIIDDFTPALTNKLRELADQHQFLLFEDRKFADIGNTVKHQYAGGIYRIADWAHIVNAHTLPGPGIISALAEIGIPKQRGLLLLAEMSSAENLLDATYAKKTLNMAKACPEFVLGFIAQHKLSNEPHWIYLTPGVQLQTGRDNLGQQYTTPEQALNQGTDIIIVGRGIVSSPDLEQTAKLYRQAGWNAYLNLLA